MYRLVRKRNFFYSDKYVAFVIQVYYYIDVQNDGDTMEFNEIIQSRRKELNKTLEDVAKDCEVSRTTVLRWESGEIKNVRRDKIAKLAKSLKVTPAHLMGWDNIVIGADLKKH